MNSKINNSKQIYSEKKTCCKVCQDAGKSEKEYSSHYVKDLNGNVTCPTLLNQECRFCYKKGHTTSHCTILKKQKDSEENSRKLPVSQPKKKVSAPKKLNVFAYLEMNSDESDDEVENFPELVVSEAKSAFEKEVSAPKKFSYASMAAKTETEYVIEKIKETKTIPTSYTPAKIYVDFILKPVSKINKSTGEKITWANCESDSDEEESTKEDNSAW